MCLDNKKKFSDVLTDVQLRLKNKIKWRCDEAGQAIVILLHHPLSQTCSFIFILRSSMSSRLFFFQITIAFQSVNGWTYQSLIKHANESKKIKWNKPQSDLILNFFVYSFQFCMDNETEVYKL
jgi:hypothetical protein